MSKLIILLVIIVAMCFMILPLSLAKAAKLGDRLNGICELNSNIECLNQCCNFCNKYCNKRCNANYRSCSKSKE